MIVQPEHPDIKLMSRALGNEYNLTPFVRVHQGMDKFDLNHQIGLMRAGFRSCENVNGYMQGLKANGVHRQKVGRVSTCKHSIFGLPQKWAFGKEGHPNHTYFSERTFIPTKYDFEQDGWKLISVMGGERYRGGIVNFMQRREENSRLYMRYWFTPSLSVKETKEGPHVSNKWTVSVEYNSRTGDHTTDVHLEEFFKFRGRMHAFTSSSKPHIGFDCHEASFTQHPVCHEDEALTFAYNNSDAWSSTIPKRELFLSAGDIGNIKGLSPEAVARMSDPGYNGRIAPEKIIAAEMLPELSAKKQKLDTKKTLENLFGVFREGSVDDLSGFKQIAFSEY